MSAKSRGNYSIGMFISQEDWDKWFPKEKEDDSQSTQSGSNSNSSIDIAIQQPEREG